MLLSPTFFCEDPIDLEHKQYVFLAAMQKLEKMFKENDVTYYEEIRFHAKNVECFLNTRGMLEGRGFPVLTDDQKRLHEIARNLPDADPLYQEALKICKWSLKRLQEKVKEGGIITKRVENSMTIYYIGKELQQSTGYLLLRYVGSSIAEVYRMTYNKEKRDVTFRSMGTYEMPGKKDFGDVKLAVLADERKKDDLFVAAEGNLSFNTKKTTLPVLKNMLIVNVFEKKSNGTKLLSLL